MLNGLFTDTQIKTFVHLRNEYVHALKWYEPTAADRATSQIWTSETYGYTVVTISYSEDRMNFNLV